MDGYTDFPEGDKRMNDLEGLYFLNNVPDEIGEEETQRLIERMREGDKDARDKLILAYTKLVIMIARRYEGWLMEFEDAVSYGFIGLMKAAAQYDPSLGYRFMTYAHIAIDRFMRRSLEREYIHRGRMCPLSLDVELAEAEGETLMDFLPDPVDEIDELIVNRIDREEVEKCMSCLTETERQFIYLKYGLDGGGQRKACDVAKMMGISKQRASAIHDKALRRMRGESRGT